MQTCQNQHSRDQHRRQQRPPVMVAALRQGDSDIICFDVEQYDALRIDWKPAATVATPTCSAAITGLEPTVLLIPRERRQRGRQRATGKTGQGSRDKEGEQ